MEEEQNPKQNPILMENTDYEFEIFPFFNVGVYSYK